MGFTEKPSESESTSFVSPDKIGAFFSRDYFTSFNDNPEGLCHYYNEMSTFCHGVEDQEDSLVIANGSSEIAQALIKLRIQDYRVIGISDLHSQECHGGILLLTIGYLCHKTTEKVRKFAQTFWLKPDPENFEVYHVINDIFRFLEDIPNEQLVQNQLPVGWNVNQNNFLNNQHATSPSGAQNPTSAATNGPAKAEDPTRKKNKDEQRKSDKKERSKRKSKRTELSSDNKAEPTPLPELSANTKKVNDNPKPQSQKPESSNKQQTSVSPQKNDQITQKSGPQESRAQDQDPTPKVPDEKHTKSINATAASPEPKEDKKPRDNRKKHTSQDQQKQPQPEKTSAQPKKNPVSDKKPTEDKKSQNATGGAQKPSPAQQPSKKGAELQQPSKKSAELQKANQNGGASQPSGAKSSPTLWTSLFTGKASLGANQGARTQATPQPAANLRSKANSGASKPTKDQSAPPDNQQDTKTQKEQQQQDEKDEQAEQIKLARSIFVSKLPQVATEKEITAVFSKHARLLEITVLANKPYCFIELESPEKVALILDVAQKTPFMIANTQVEVEARNRKARAVPKDPSKKSKKRGKKENSKDKESPTAPVQKEGQPHFHTNNSAKSQSPEDTKSKLALQKDEKKPADSHQNLNANNPNNTQKKPQTQKPVVHQKQTDQPQKQNTHQNTAPKKQAPTNVSTKKP